VIHGVFLHVDLVGHARGEEIDAGIDTNRGARFLGKGNEVVEETLLWLD
jgi:hypothetical protein